MFVFGGSYFEQLVVPEPASNERGNECPVHMEKKPNNKSHGLIFPEKNDLKLSLEMSG
jgi:hypothetical protein